MSNLVTSAIPARISDLVLLPVPPFRPAGPFRAAKVSDDRVGMFKLLEFRVFFPSLLQNGNIWVGIFPNGKEILIRNKSLRHVP